MTPSWKRFWSISFIWTNIYSICCWSSFQCYCCIGQGLVFFVSLFFCNLFLKLVHFLNLWLQFMSWCVWPYVPRIFVSTDLSYINVFIPSLVVCYIMFTTTLCLLIGLMNVHVSKTPDLSLWFGQRKNFKRHLIPFFFIYLV